MPIGLTLSPPGLHIWKLLELGIITAVTIGTGFKNRRTEATKYTRLSSVLCCIILHAVMIIDLTYTLITHRSEPITGTLFRYDDLTLTGEVVICIIQFVLWMCLIAAGFISVILPEYRDMKGVAPGSGGVNYNRLDEEVTYNRSDDEVSIESFPKNVPIENRWTELQEMTHKNMIAFGIANSWLIVWTHFIRSVHIITEFRMTEHYVSLTAGLIMAVVVGGKVIDIFVLKDITKNVYAHYLLYSAFLIAVNQEFIDHVPYVYPDVVAVFVIVMVLLTTAYTFMAGFYDIRVQVHSKDD